MELVRVRIKNGSKYRRKNMGRTLAEAADNVEILEDEPTHRPDGTPLPETTDSGRPPKPPTTVDEQATAKKATARSASTDEKE
jgi:hypothetical protein